MSAEAPTRRADSHVAKPGLEDLRRLAREHESLAAFQSVAIVLGLSPEEADEVWAHPESDVVPRSTAVTGHQIGDELALSGTRDGEWVLSRTTADLEASR